MKIYENYKLLSIKKHKDKIKINQNIKQNWENILYKFK